MENPLFHELKKHLSEIKSIEAVMMLLVWDQQVYLPNGGAVARSRQLAVQAQLAHEKLTAPIIGKLLDDLQSYQINLPYDSDEAGLLRVTRRLYEKAVKVPPAFKARLSAHLSKSYQVWTLARPANDFAAVQPYLEKTLSLSREYAHFFPDYALIADPLIDFKDTGMTVAAIRPFFAELRRQLVPMIKDIREQPLPDNSCLYRTFPTAAQLSFVREVIKNIGFDFERGRQDLSPHPFESLISIGDVRMTTRVQENDLSQTFLDTLHEMGHALYDQGLYPDFEGTPLADSASASVTESQARLWENVIGRSRYFWNYYYPKLQAIFQEQLNSTSLETFYRAINKVQPSLIRIDADEMSYDLHVILRFDFELQLLEGTLAVRDLPEAYRERFKADFGITPPDNRDGVLQDVHWFDGVIGGQFQSYTIGNILSVQFYEAALREHPEILDEIAHGEFSALHNWLKEHIYRHGRKYTTMELIQRVTGKSLTIEPYIRYLRTKYGELYNL
ncbi:MAG: carboxypeptidase M32 [Proteobacteria bacterium]|nr:carboxypeptidase M32 [Desulfobacteraceae bacterium]MBU4012759.1 carboxypeptidase M32 [Pseudomonadota bacterium]MBU4127847.1 carboxypeptidase M32 [Pseudomonadota bacterium]